MLFRTTTKKIYNWSYISYHETLNSYFNTLIDGDARTFMTHSVKQCNVSLNEKSWSVSCAASAVSWKTLKYCTFKHKPTGSNQAVGKCVGNSYIFCGDQHLVSENKKVFLGFCRLQIDATSVSLTYFVLLICTYKKNFLALLKCEIIRSNPKVIFV